MKAYKGFNKDFKCMNFQYDVGKTYETKKKIGLCENGFHSCKNPIDVFSYYNDPQGKYAEVEILGKTKENNNKIVTSKIRIVKEISFWDIFKMNMQIVIDLCVKSSKKSTAGNRSHANTAGNRSHANTAGWQSHANTAGNRSHANTAGWQSHANTAGDESHANTAGNRSHANTAGNRSHANTAGNRSHANTAGWQSHANTAGDESHANTAGNRSHANTAGNRSHANTAGNRSHANTAGNRSHANTAGWQSHANTAGRNSISSGFGYKNKAKAVKGWIVLAEYDNNYDIIHIKSGKVGKQIKSDIWYKLENNKFVKCEK